jgi:hypothetical protein
MVNVLADLSLTDEDAPIAGMGRHNAEVRAYVRQLLEWSPADGWGPCASSLNAQCLQFRCHA